jgi:iron complex transport system ATP-binding protein
MSAQDRPVGGDLGRQPIGVADGRASATLSARSLSVALGGVTVLHEVSLDLQPGWTAIVGPNGAGKSTLLRALAGLVPVQSGEVRLQGRPLPQWRARQRAQQIAWLAQQGQAGGDLTVRELVRLGRVPYLGLLGMPGPDDERRVDEAMQATECAAWQERRLQQLSGGERQRCLLARALAVGAPVMLLDEPTTHLDPPHQVAVVRLLQRLGRSCTVASVLHDLPLALQADRVLLMRAGRVVAEGAHDDPRLHGAICEVFEHAVHIQRVGDRHVALPVLR